MKPGTCSDCDAAHDPAERCSPGRRRATAIDFPSWAKVTKCEHSSRSVIVFDRHGAVHEVWSRLTPFGRTMAAWREREAARPYTRDLPLSYWQSRSTDSRFRKRAMS